MIDHLSNNIGRTLALYFSFEIIIYCSDPHDENPKYIYFKNKDYNVYVEYILVLLLIIIVHGKIMINILV